MSVLATHISTVYVSLLAARSLSYFLVVFAHRLLFADTYFTEKFESTYDIYVNTIIFLTRNIFHTRLQRLAPEGNHEN